MANPNLGFFLGGVKKQENIVAQRELDKQKQTLAFRKQVTDQAKVLTEQFDAIVGDPNFDKERLAPVYDTFLQIAEAQDNNERAVGLSGTNVAKFRTKWNAALDSMQQQAMKTAREIVDVQAKQEAGTAAPAESTPQIVKLQDQRDAAVRAGDAKSAREIQAQIDKIGTIVGRTPEDVGLTGDVNKKRTGEVRTGIRSLTGNIEQLQGTLQKFENTPLAGGALGAILDTAAGALGQVDQLVGTDLANALPGDQAKIKEARTRAKFAAAQMLSTITGESSGRFTDTERKIADQALATLDASASPDQIKTAMETAITIMRDSLNRLGDELLATSGLDISKPEGIDRFSEILQENGLTEQQAEDVIFAIIQRRGIKL